MFQGKNLNKPVALWPHSGAQAPVQQHTTVRRAAAEVPPAPPGNRGNHQH